MGMRNGGWGRSYFVGDGRGLALWVTASSAALVCLGFFGCSGSKTKSNSPSGGDCPANPGAISELPWQLSGDAFSAVQSGLLASNQLALLATVMEEDLNAACVAIAGDLFVAKKQLEPPGYDVGAEGIHTCGAAAEAITKMKTIAGGELTVQAQFPTCTTALNVADECLRGCSAVDDKGKRLKKQPEIAKLECAGQLTGTCDGACDGLCVLSEESNCAGKCSGSCDGSCDSEFNGACPEKCEGTCDGKPSTGSCEGTCVGRCMENARGTCGGTCLGSCDGACAMQAAGECEGLCSGSCDKPLKDPECAGGVQLPSPTGDCQSACHAAVLAGIECSEPQVKVTLEKPQNAEAAEALQRTLSENLPRLLSARALGMDQSALGTAAETSGATVEKMKTSAAGAEPPLQKKDLECVDQAVVIQQQAASAIPSLLAAADSVKSAAGVPQ